MTNRAKLSVAAGVLTALFGFAGYQYYNRDPFNEPGQTWRNDTLLTWESIRLLDSGKYVAREWCDVCPVQVTSGIWSKQDNVILLKQTEPDGRIRELLEVESAGCRLLVHPKAIVQDGRVNPLMSYLREGEPCEFTSLGYERKL